VDHEGVTEPCSQCGAPLAEDQRYCLQCGEPRPHLGGPPSAKPATDRSSQVPPTPPGFSTSVEGAAGTQPGRNNSIALLAGVGVLLLAMGVGVLIGRAGAGTSKASPAQVISVGGSAAGGATTSTTPTTTTEAPASSAPKKKEAAKAKESSGTGNSITKPAPPNAAKNLRGGSGQSYEQKSKNLPNVVGT
jgi:hypothetical protein